MQDSVKQLLDLMPLKPPQHTHEFPRGLINDYIRAVDELRKAQKERRD